jgi:hypothetical protein
MGETTTRSELFEALTMARSDHTYFAPRARSAIGPCTWLIKRGSANSSGNIPPHFLPGFFWTAVASAARHRFAFPRFAGIRTSTGVLNRLRGHNTAEKRRRRYALPAQSKMKKTRAERAD